MGLCYGGIIEFFILQRLFLWSERKSLDHLMDEECDTCNKGVEKVMKCKLRHAKIMFAFHVLKQNLRMYLILFVIHILTILNGSRRRILLKIMVGLLNLLICQFITKKWWMRFGNMVPPNPVTGTFIYHAINFLMKIQNLDIIVLQLLYLLMEISNQTTVKLNLIRKEFLIQK